MTLMMVVLVVLVNCKVKKISPTPDNTGVGDYILMYFNLERF